MLKLHDLYKVYRTDEVETVALNGVNFEIEQGDFVAVMGPSGCGKSTLLNIVGLLDNLTEGSYFFFDENVAGYKVYFPTIRSEYMIPIIIMAIISTLAY